MLLTRPDLGARNRIFGQIARRYGFLNEEQLAAAAGEIIALAQRGRGADLGEICVMLGYLTEDERRRIAIARDYYFARKEDELIGQVALRYRMLSSEEVRECLRKEEEIYLSGTPRVPRLLGLLSERRVLSPEELLLLLKMVQRHAMFGRTFVLSSPPSEVSAPARSKSQEGPNEPQVGRPFHEARSAERFVVADTLVHVCQQKIWPFERPSARVVEAGPLVDLSPYGLQAMSLKAFEIDQPLHLSIHVPVFSHPLETDGSVRWMARGDGRYRLGVAFTRMDTRTESLLEKLASNPFLRSLDRSVFELVPAE